MRIVTGIQPSGKLHIGNYFGMVQPALALAQANEAFYFIADYHALTAPAPELRDNSLTMMLDLIACGFDPEKITLYRQSDIPCVAELALILSCVSPMPMLENAHSYKDKIAQGIKPNVGLFTYPILMAADILLMQAHKVPVGKDQKQHLEIARDIAGIFNRRFGETFVLPEPIIRSETLVVGIDGRKMSKSYGNTIEVFATDEETERQVNLIAMDSQALHAPKIDLEQNIPLQLYKLLVSPAEAEEMHQRVATGGYGYGALKAVLCEALLTYFGPIKARRKNTQANLDALRAGKTKAQMVAVETMRRVHTAINL